MESNKCRQTGGGFSYNTIARTTLVWTYENHMEVEQQAKNRITI